MKKSITKSPKPVKTAAAIPPGYAEARPVRKAPAAAAAAGVAVKMERKTPVKMPAAKTTSTTILAQINVGYGNTLYIRGEGPGLSWDRGLAMDCVADETWSITISDATVPVTFKFLLNDITWCAGEDYVAVPGAKFAASPAF